jgi:hypothetical protein
MSQPRTTYSNLRTGVIIETVSANVALAAGNKSHALRHFIAAGKLLLLIIQTEKPQSVEDVRLGGASSTRNMFLVGYGV